MAKTVSQYSRLLNAGLTNDPYITPKNLRAVMRHDYSGVDLYWDNPNNEYWTHTWLLKSSSGFPVSIIDVQAVSLYKGQVNTFFDPNVSPLTTQYYSVFGVNNNAFEGQDPLVWLTSKGWQRISTNINWDNDKGIIQNVWGWKLNCRTSLLIPKDYNITSIMYGDN